MRSCIRAASTACHNLNLSIWTLVQRFSFHSKYVTTIEYNKAFVYICTSIYIYIYITHTYKSQQDRCIESNQPLLIFGRTCFPMCSPAQTLCLSAETNLDQLDQTTNIFVNKYGVAEIIPLWIYMRHAICQQICLDYRLGSVL